MELKEFAPGCVVLEQLNVSVEGSSAFLIPPENPDESFLQFK